MPVILRKSIVFLLRGVGIYKSGRRQIIQVIGSSTSNVVNRFSQRTKVIAVSAIFLIFSLFIQQVSFAQTTIWNEDFDSYANNSGVQGAGIQNIGDYPSSVSKWTIDASALSMQNSDDYFKVTNGSFVGWDLHGTVIWQSESIDISSFSDISISADIWKESGTMEPVDEINFYYQIDGGGWNPIAELNDDINTSPQPYSINNLNGNSLQLRFEVTLTNGGIEAYAFDDILVQGIPQAPPTCTTPVSPSDGAVDFAVDGTLTWDAAPGATGYIIYFGTDASATNIENGTDLGNVTSYQPSANLDFLTGYYWQIVPYNSYGIASGCSTWNFVTTDLSYCSSNGTTQYSDGITLVDFNTINNITGKTAGYNDYTSITTDLIIGNSYDLTVNLNTDGNYINYAIAWIDWNHNGDFNDAGEEFDLGRVTNNSNGATSNSPLSVTVPSSASVGVVRMRVSTKYNSYPTACETNFDGEVEDYSVQIFSPCNLAIQNVTGGGSYCSGDAGVEVGLDDSETGVTYTLYRNGTSTGISVNGSGSAITFGNQTLAGTYTVIGHNVAEDCDVNMNGSAEVVVKSVPSAPTVGTVTQPDCSTSTGSIVLNGLPSTGTWTLTRTPGGTTYTGTGASTTIPGLTANDYTFTVTHQASGTGLSAEYFNNMTLNGTPDLTQTDATVNFDWANGGPGTPIGVDNFSVRWSGKVLPLFTENYTFSTNSDDGIRLWINGTLIIDNWTDHAATINTGTINLTAGVLYDIVLEFYENGGQAVAQLSWGSASQVTEIIPQAQLYPTGTLTSDCPSPVSATVTINNQPISTAIITHPSPSNQEICLNESATSLSVSATGTNINYQWYSNTSASPTGGSPVGTNTNSYTPPTNTIGALYYYCVVTGDCGTVTSNVSGSVNVNPLPTVVANATSTEICAGESVTLTGSGATSYVWDNGVSDGVSFTPVSTTTYTVTGTDANGCVNTDQITITVNPLPTITLTYNLSETCSGDDMVSFDYSATSGSPDKYNIDFDTDAEAEGFADVTGASLTGGVIYIDVPTSGTPATYHAVLTVTNSTTNCTSTSYNITIVIDPLPATGPIISD